MQHRSGRNKKKIRAGKTDTNGRPFFVIVHGALLEERTDRRQFKEIQRIKKEEDFAVVGGLP